MNSTVHWVQPWESRVILKWLCVSKTKKNAANKLEERNFIGLANKNKCILPLVCFVSWGELVACRCHSLFCSPIDYRAILFHSRLLSSGKMIKSLLHTSCTFINHLKSFKLLTFIILPVLSDLIDDMAEKLQASLGVEEFSSLCVPSQVSSCFFVHFAISVNSFILNQNSSDKTSIISRGRQVAFWS